MKKYSDYMVRQDGRFELTPGEFKNVEWVNFIIVVPTERDRNELMEAFEHIHYSDIDTDYIAVNQLAHQYLDDTREPGSCNNIIVDEEAYNNALNRIVK